MKKLICLCIVSSFVLTACESVAPLRYGEKKYQPTMSEAEMNIRQNEIEDIEAKARKQNREEMMDRAEAINKARGTQTIILH